MLTRGDIGKPPRPVPLVASDLSGPAADLAVTWLGHASALLEIDGLRVLADPVWSERVSPSPAGRARSGCTPCPSRSTTCRRSTR